MLATGLNPADLNAATNLFYVVACHHLQVVVCDMREFLEPASAGLKELQEALAMFGQVFKPAEAGSSSRGLTAPPPEGGGKQRPGQTVLDRPTTRHPDADGPDPARDESAVERRRRVGRSGRALGQSLQARRENLRNRNPTQPAQQRPDDRHMGASAIHNEIQNRPDQFHARREDLGPRPRHRHRRNRRMVRSGDEYCAVKGG